MTVVSILFSVWASYRRGFYSKKRMKAKSRFSLAYIFLLITMAAMAARVYLEYQEYAGLSAYAKQRRSSRWLDDEAEIQSPITEEELAALQHHHKLLSEFESATNDAKNVLNFELEAFAKTVVPAANPDFVSLAFIPVSRDGGDKSAKFRFNSREPLNLIVEVVDRDDLLVSNQFVVPEVASKNDSQWTVSTQPNLSTTLQEQGMTDSVRFKLLAGQHSLRVKSEFLIPNSGRNWQYSLELSIDGKATMKCLLPTKSSAYFRKTSTKPGSVLEIKSADELNELPSILEISSKTSKGNRCQLRFRLEAEK